MPHAFKVENGVRVPTLPQQSPEERLAALLGCRHRGGPTGRETACGECGSRHVLLPVLSCAVHGECTVRTAEDRRVKGCRACDDRQARPVVQVESPSGGVGDHLLALCVAEGLKRQHPQAEIVYVSPAHVWPWLSLFGVADRFALAEQPGLVAHCNHRLNHLWYGRGIARWEYWQELHGVTAAVPEPKPLPADALEWAAAYAGKVVIAPFAAWKERTWPIERWLAVERLLMAEGFPTLVLDDKPYRVLDFQGLKMTGQPAARVAAVMHYATAFAGNDSGMAHLAGMLRTPGVAVSAHASDDRIMGLYPSVRELGGRRLGFEGVTPAEVVAAVLAQVRAGLGAFPAGRFRDTLPPCDHRGDSWLPIYAALWRTARELRPKRVVEIGVRAGQSAWTILDACPDATVHGIDLDGGDGGFPGAAGHARKVCGDRLTVQLADSHTLEAVPPYDLCYVDGDHSEGGCLADLLLAARSGDGVILVDDYANREGVRNAVRRLCAEHPLRKGRFIPSQTGLFLIDRPPVAVVTAWDAAFEPVAALTWPALQGYAERHGYSAVRGEIDASRPASWSKLPALLKALEAHEVVLWLDADALITGDADPCRLLGNADFAYAEDVNGFNAGVLIMRSIPWVKDALKAAWGEYERFKDHCWWEQLPLGEAIARHRDRCRVLTLRQLQSRWEKGAGCWEAGDFCLHLPGVANERRVEIFGEVLGRDRS